MLHFTWSDAYSVGLPDIDAQHRMILCLLERLQGQHEAGASLEALKPVVAEVQRYVLFHLSSEETLQQFYEYPEFFAHKRGHVEFVSDLENRVQQCMAGDLSVNKLLLFIVGWFVSHSTHEDKRYGEHVRACRQELGLNVDGYFS